MTNKQQSVLERATAHFRARISGKMSTVHVPEWDTTIWYKEATTLKEEAKLIELTQNGKTVEALVETLIVKARNEDGSKMFNIAEKAIFMNEVDPNVLIRVVSEINTASVVGTLEQAEKN